MIVRAFNELGLQNFRAYLSACRADPTLPPPRERLDDDQLATVLDPAVRVEPRTLTTKSDAAHYLARMLEPISETQLLKSAGMWSWLTLFYFDEVCPPRDGKRTVRNDYYYVFAPHKSHHFYRHLLFNSWRVLKLAKEHNRLFLSGALSTFDSVTDETMKRLYLTRIPCVFEVLDRLYWDDSRGKPRTGITGTAKTKPGDLTHRFPARIRQLERTYDLYSLTADQLLDLLGEEFAFAGTVSAPRQQVLPLDQAAE